MKCGLRSTSTVLNTLNPEVVKARDLTVALAELSKTINPLIGETRQCTVAMTRSKTPSPENGG
jgi:hypothetical protein